MLLEKNGWAGKLCESEDWFRNNVSLEVRQYTQLLSNQVKLAYDNFDLNQAALSINKLNDYGNKYLQENAPWSKDTIDQNKLQTLIDAWWTVKNIIKLYEPIIPSKIKDIKLQVDSWSVLRDLSSDFEPEPVHWFEPLRQKQKE